MEEEAKNSNIKSTIEAATALVKAVPVYDDALQPGAKEVGKSLETIGKAVNVALVPLRLLIWGYEQIEGWIVPTLVEKLRHTPEEQIVSPSPQIAGPAIEALRYVANEANLRELYANLIASSMDSQTSHLAHPGYVEIIKNLSADEAVLIRAFIEEDAYPSIDLKGNGESGKQYSTFYTNFTPFHRMAEIRRPDLIPSYINNLCRLGLLEQPFNSIVTDDPDEYQILLGDSFLDPYKEEIVECGLNIGVSNRAIFVTSYGRHFIDNVVKTKD